MNHGLLLCPVLPGYDFLKFESYSYQSMTSLVCVVYSVEAHVEFISNYVLGIKCEFL